ncbi:hypothetical protein MLD38_005496 [Melastoma candidum]|uniref:Uncharacterized protein n=1 Tax=Melastoma candidum TaxID=119954 RepID=A0ACB9RJV5_9MYRT|nr:hypothetical protein MLD38_005496 [Melastoma candidum]
MATVLLSLLFLLLQFRPSASSSPSYVAPGGTLLAYNLDCGGNTTFTDSFNSTWLSDRYFSGGASSVVSDPLNFPSPQDRSLRYFPLSSGKKNCYSIPVNGSVSSTLSSSRFLLRTFTVYADYDGLSRAPSFDVSVQSTVIFSWRYPWPEQVSSKGAFSDLFVFVPGNVSTLDLCFYSIATDAPVVGALSLFQIDPLAYDSIVIGEDYMMVNYGRLDCGSAKWGSGISNDKDLFGRNWQSDYEFQWGRWGQFVHVLTTMKPIAGTGLEPNYFSMKLYQTAITVTEEGVSIEYDLEVDAKQDYLLWLHFAEIGQGVNGVGERVFDVQVNGENQTRVDVYKEVGPFAAYDWHFVARNLTTNVLSLKLVPVVGKPIICGIENYALVPIDISTDPQQVTAMRALKDALRIPERMGWNGDPCAPKSWDAWEGVTCHLNQNKTALTIFQIDLGNRGLKGYISDQIGLLSDLVSLNLSSNSLGGTIPWGLGIPSLAWLDLSNNQFTGSIPDTLATPKMQLVHMNNNLLEGQVPEKLYEIAVHGGSIDLSGNKESCGQSPLPSCSVLWKNGGLSPGGKVAVGLSCVVFSGLLLGLYLCCFRRRHSNYEFGLPLEMMSLAAKRNKYQRQKSLMLLEMESRHAKGLPPIFSANNDSPHAR